MRPNPSAVLFVLSAFLTVVAGCSAESPTDPAAEATAVASARWGSLGSHHGGDVPLVHAEHPGKKGGNGVTALPVAAYEDRYGEGIGINHDVVFQNRDRLRPDRVLRRVLRGQYPRQAGVPGTGRVGPPPSG